MAAKLDYEQTAYDIVMSVGGPENIKVVAHCMTRIRFLLKDPKKANTSDVKAVPGVLGVFDATGTSGEYMVILGANLLPVYEAVQKKFNFTAGDTVNENLDPSQKKPLTVSGVISDTIGFISASVAPCVPGLIAGGMLKVFLLLGTLISSSFAGTGVYRLLSIAGDAPFYFLPVFVAYGAANKLGGTPAYAMICALSLLHNNWLAILSAKEPITMLMVPVRLMSYSGSLVPALLLSWCAAKMEKWLNKVVPGIFKAIFVGMGTVALTMVFGFTILAPLGGYLGIYLGNLFAFLANNIGPVTVGILACVLPWLIIAGMHHSLVPFMAQSISNPGYDAIFRPAFLLHNMSEGGACIGSALREKDPEKRAEIFSLGVGCIFAGVTEPAIYGNNLPKKTPMYGVMAGGAAGGIVAGFLGARAYVMGYSTILAVPIFQDTIIGILVAIATSIVVAGIVAFVLGGPAAKAGEDKAIDAAKNMLYAPVSGKYITLKEINDGVFSEGMLGQGCGIIPDNGTVFSPVNGEVVSIADSRHAVGIKSDDGAEILIHIGLDTVAMNGKGFRPQVKEGDRLKAGQKIMEFDMAAIVTAGKSAISAFIITNSDDCKLMDFKTGEKYEAGEIFGTVEA
ncbi:MAG: PTS glucose transporter subunit IIA [Synergistaceae bacterium]|nr:PTS glucose transporter subunit IIA [Synergistaceae bacterium]